MTTLSVLLDQNLFEREEDEPTPPPPPKPKETQPPPPKEEDLPENKRLVNKVSSSLFAWSISEESLLQFISIITCLCRP